MAFNLENKLTFEELAPSLQQMINSKTNRSDYDVTAALVLRIYNNLGTVRVTIGGGTGAVSGPQNGKELLINTADHSIQGYANEGWCTCGGVYS